MAQELTSQALEEKVRRLEERVAELEHAETELRRTEGRYRTALDSLPFDVFLLDESGRYAFQNAACRTHWGDFVGKQPEDLNVDEETLALWKSNNRRAYRGETVKAEVSFPVAEKERSFYNIISPIVEDATIRGILGVNIDITELRQIEQELRQSEARAQHRLAELEALMEAVPAYIWMTRDPEGKMMSGNRAVYELVGVPSGSNVSKAALDQTDSFHFKTFKDNVEVPVEELPIQLAARGQEVRDYEVELRFDDDTSRYLLGNAVPLRRENGSLTGALSAFIDITGRKEAEEQLRTSEQKYRLLFETMSEGFALAEVIRDKQGSPCDYRVQEVNSAFTKLTGIPAAMAVGRTVRELAPAAAADWMEALGSVALTREPNRFQNYASALDKWFDVFAFRPEPGKIATLFIDITAQKQAEQSQQRLFHQLNTLIRVSQDVLAETSIAGVLQRVLHAACAVTGARLAASSHDYTDGIFHVTALSCSGEPPPCMSASVALERRGGVYRRLLEKQSTLRFTEAELSRHPSWWGIPEGHAPLRGLLGASLTGSDGAVVGLIMVTDKEAGDFTADDEAVLAQLASLASLGLQHVKARSEAEQRTVELEALMEATPALVWIARDPDCRTIIGNRFTYEKFQLPPGSNLSRTPVGAERPLPYRSMHDGVEVAADQLPSQRAAHGEEVRDYELELRFNNGSQRYFLGNATPLRNEDGIPFGSVAAFFDITERKRMEEALRLSEWTLRTLYEAMAQGVVYHNAAGKLTIANPAAERILGLSLTEMHGRLVTDPRWNAVREDGTRFSPDEFPPMRALQTGRNVAGVLMGIFNPHENSYRWVMVDSIPQFRPQEQTPIGVFTVFSDVTELKHAQEGLHKANEELEQRIQERTAALRQSEQRLRQLSSQLLEAQENERKRVANEIHDNAGQVLAAIKYRIESALLKLQKTGVEETLQPVKDLIPVVQTCIDDMRRLQMELRPSTLDEMGLLATIGWFCREFHKTYPSISVERSLAVKEVELPESLKLVMFRIVQEALNNVGKHSDASRVQILLERKEGMLRLHIADDGRGFDLEEMHTVKAFGQGLGLSSMRERAQYSGGTLTIESAPGIGTRIGAQWPITALT